MLSHLEIYNQIWYVRDVPRDTKHSLRVIELVKDVIERLENIPDGCAECFPFDLIDELTEDYLEE